MRRRHQAPQRSLLPVPPERCINACTSHGSPQLEPIRRRRILRTVLPQGIRSHSQQKEVVLSPPSALCPQNCQFRGETLPFTQVCPPNPSFRGRTQHRTSTSPPKAPFRGETTVVHHPTVGKISFRTARSRFNILRNCAFEAL